MARVASSRKSCLLVVRIVCVVIVRHVAIAARPTGQVVIVVDVTLRAGQIRVRPG